MEDATLVEAVHNVQHLCSVVGEERIAQVSSMSIGKVLQWAHDRNTVYMYIQSTTVCFMYIPAESRACSGVEP